MSANKLFFNGPSSIIVPRLTADPSSPINGEMYYNITNNKFRVYENGAWTDSVGGGGGNWWETVLLNDTFVKARNAANSADIDLFKLTTSDVIEFSAAISTVKIAEISDNAGDIAIDLTGGARILHDSDTFSAIDIGLSGVTIKPTGSADARELVFENGDSSASISVKAPETLTAWTFVLPPDDGTNGYVLQTDGNGVTSWVAPSGGITWSTPVDNSIIPDAPSSYDIGAAGFEFTNLYIDKIYGVDNCGARSIDVTNGELQDASAVISVNWTQRSLHNNAGDQRLRYETYGALRNVTTGEEDVLTWGDSNVDANDVELRTGDISGTPVARKFKLWDQQNLSTRYVAVRAPNSLTSAVDFVLPPNEGTDGYVLHTDGSGNTSWKSIHETTSVALTGGSGTPIAISGIYCDNSEDIQAFEVDYVITDDTTNDQRFGKLLAVISKSATPTSSLSDVLNIQTASIPYVFSLVVSGDRATLNYTSTGANNSTMNYTIKRLIFS